MPACAVVIFGASGDLTRRKLIPALYDLTREGLLPEGIAVLGAARSPKSDEEFRQELRQSTAIHARSGALDEAVWNRFARQVHYQTIQYDDPGAYRQIASRLEQLCQAHGTCGRHLLYLSVPPSAGPTIIEHIGRSKLHELMLTDEGWCRIVIEKPFGHDLPSAQRLNQQLTSVFHEDQIYRIDHYLGKETVQNLLVTRFANGIFEPIWNRRYVDHVQITVAESLGLEGRGKHYDDVGCLRDMVQNHLLQILCLVAMEPPASLRADAIRNEKSKVLESIRPIPPDAVGKWAVRAQYDRGRDEDGEPAAAYLEEPGVAEDSSTETYAAVKLMIDNWRWSGVPFYLRSGKRLARRLTEVAIQFRTAPMLLFGEHQAGSPRPNALVLQIQPQESIAIDFSVKRPGAGMVLHPTSLAFDYAEAFDEELPEAYERLLLDCMLGDASLFARADWVESAWQAISPVLDDWNSRTGPLATYRAGSDGPREADLLLAGDGRAWRAI